VQDALTALDGFVQTDHLAFRSREMLGCNKRLREKTLQTPRTKDSLPVLGGKLLEAKHRDDVLEFFVLRKLPAHLLRNAVMTLADD
jgi:hypothetical protein